MMRFACSPILVEMPVTIAKHTMTKHESKHGAPKKTPQTVLLTADLFHIYTT